MKILSFKAQSHAVLVLLILGVILSDNAFAQRPGGKKIVNRDEVRQRNDSNARKPGNLALTAEQKKLIKESRVKLLKQTIPLKNQIKEKVDHVKTLSSVDKPDMIAINATIDEIASLKAQKMKLVMAHRQVVRSLLNDEQRLIYDSRGFHRMGKRNQDRRNSQNMDQRPGMRKMRNDKNDVEIENDEF